MQLTGVLISTSADRFDRLRQFYVTTLGLTPRSDRPGFVNFDSGHCRLTVAIHDAVSGSSSDPARIMVNLATVDVDDAVQRCDPSTVVRSPEREKWGGLVATVTDPDGNYVQFLQLE
jgi:predicted enzyme related to lactoylglutathione lyase